MWREIQAWNWHVIEINGHDASAIRKALTEAKAVTGKPTLLIGKTIIGKGARKEDGTSYEGKCETHGMPLSAAGASFEKTIKNLGGNPEDPFAIFKETRALYANVKKITTIMLKYTEEKAWAAANPALAEKLACSSRRSFR